MNRRAMQLAAMIGTILMGPDDSEGADCTKRVGSGEPFQTIQAAVDAAVPGDVICVLPATYTLSSPIVVRIQGTASAPVEIRTEGSVTLTDPSSTLGVWSGLVQVEGAAWVILRGFHLVEIAWFGVMVTGSDHITVDGLTTERSLGSGIFVSDSANVTVSNNDIGYCCLGTSSVLNPDGNIVGSQECISIGATTNFDVGYNHVHDSPVGETGGEGIDAKGGSRTGRIHHNRVHNLVRLGIYVDSYGTTGDIEIDSNEVFETYVGIVVASEDGSRVDNIRIHDNILHHNGGDWAPYSAAYPYKEFCGISIPNYSSDGPRSDIAIYNNTIVANTWEGQGVGIRVQTTNAANVVVRNNLIAGQTDGLIAASAASVTEAANNLVYPFESSAGEIEGTNDVHEPPLFVNEAGYDYHLKGASPARDRGCAGPPVAAVDADGNPRVIGSTVDIGAYEYGTADTTPPAAPLGLSVN